MNQPVIDINGLSKNFAAVQALRNINLQVEQGELFGLIGPDGAGKSTLYRILTTLLQPDHGTARVCGYDIVSQYRQIRDRVGYMPQRFSLYPDLSVMENLNFFASLFGVKVKDNYDIIAPVFGQLAKFPNRRAGALSGGMKQKLALSSALIHKPELLLLDEPTTGVDAVSRSEFWQILKELKRRDISIMVSTSYMDEAQLCERVALINNGSILAVDTPDKLSASIRGTLYAASATDMFRLLETLRSYPEITFCYTFGASIHMTYVQGVSPQFIQNRLRHDGIEDAVVRPTDGDIEDLFIKLMQQ